VAAAQRAPAAAGGTIIRGQAAACCGICHRQGLQCRLCCFCRLSLLLQLLLSLLLVVVVLGKARLLLQLCMFWAEIAPRMSLQMLLLLWQGGPQGVLPPGMHLKQD
jgi:hypothetical protein